jgi:hypothetical protein
MHSVLDAQARYGGVWKARFKSREKSLFDFCARKAVGFKPLTPEQVGLKKRWQLASISY